MGKTDRIGKLACLRIYFLRYVDYMYLVLRYATLSNWSP